MRIGCIIQARLDSSRLPNKVNEYIGPRRMLDHVVERCETIEPRFPVFVAWDIDSQCDSSDVLQRYLLASHDHCLSAIMRVTSDCPLIDPAACKRVLDVFRSGHYDYVCNDLWPSYPDGLGCEIFTRASLEEAHKHAKSVPSSDREHVTPWIKRGLNLVGGRRYCGLNLRCPIVGLENLKFSVDTQEDLDRVRAIHAQNPRDFSLEQTLDAAKKAGIWLGL